LLVEEAGGIVSDTRGQPINFGLGRTLGDNHGITACFSGLHQAVLDAVKKVKAEDVD
jgi:3'(2'), 5'-bisphosphate nucleotidase